MPRILQVEDHEDESRHAVPMPLKRWGFDVLLAGDGAKGVATAAAERPDLTLMEMSLPVVDGWEATRRLEADPATRALSGN